MQQNLIPTSNSSVGSGGDRGSNQRTVRAFNERLVLTLIRQNGSMAKAEIARITGLSAQAVSVIVRALETDGLLTKGAPVRGKVGQPSVPMTLAGDGAFFLGLKVGRRSLDLILIDFQGATRARRHHIYHHPDPDSIVAFAIEDIAALLDSLSPSERERVAGLGIAIPFRLWDWASDLGLAPGEMDMWRNRDIANEIGNSLAFPVYLRNDASAACGAELVFGDQDRPRNFLYFFLGFFVGGGMVLDNVLYTGQSGNAAALGPMPIHTASGKSRRLIDVASLVSLEKALTLKGIDSAKLWKSAQTWDIPSEILDHWVDNAAEGLAMAIETSASLIDFECVMIDGWLPETVRSRIVTAVTSKLGVCTTVGIDMPEVRAGTIGSDARSLGAASLPLSDRFLVDRSAFF